MTINEFCKKLSTIKADWYFDYDLSSLGTIRADSLKGCCLCPINLVFRYGETGVPPILLAFTKPGNSLFHEMGDRIGLSLKDTKEIVYASDGEDGHSKKLRRRLKQIVGLL